MCIYRYKQISFVNNINRTATRNNVISRTNKVQPCRGVGVCGIEHESMLKINHEAIPTISVYILKQPSRKVHNTHIPFLTMSYKHVSS